VEELRLMQVEFGRGRENMFDLNYYYIVREEEGQDVDGKEIPPGK